MDIELLLIIFTLLLFVALYAVREYNDLSSLKGRIDNVWNQLADLFVSRHVILEQFLATAELPAADHEAFTQLLVVAKASSDVTTTLVAEKALTQALATLFATPEFFADNNFGNALRVLHSSEQRLALAHMQYNDVVLVYLNKLESFPTNMIASLYNFKAAPLSE